MKPAVRLRIAMGIFSCILFASSCEARRVADPSPQAQIQPQEQSPVESPNDSAIPIDTDRLTVITDPAGCLVLLDERVVGKSPLTILSLPSRTMVLRVEKAGFLPAVKEIKTGEGQHLIVDLSLSADAEGKRIAEASDTLKVAGVASDDVLNLRAGPGAEQRIIAKLSPAETGIVARGPEERVEGQTWRQVEWKGQVGWVNATYIVTESATGTTSRYSVPDHPNFDAWLDKTLTYRDVETRSTEELRLWRNYFYAVDGYSFKSEDLKTYFSSLPWYAPRDDFSEPNMPLVHRSNARILKKIEDQVPYLQQRGSAKGIECGLNDTMINMRAAPSLKAATLFTLDRGDIVYVDARTSAQDSVTTSVLKDVKDYWFRVETELGASAWIFGHFLVFPAGTSKESIDVID